MKHTHRNNLAIVTVVTLLTCLVLFSQQSLAAEESIKKPRIIDGSKVTLFFRLTVPGEQGFEVRNSGKFVQGQHQLLPALERVMTGMKSGDETKVELSVEEAFGPYDGRKKTTVPREDLPAHTKQGDVLEDRSGNPVTVTQLSDTAAVMDYNHPLAGKPLVVKLRILRVDNPS